MNTIADLNYQTTFGMKQGLKQAEIIQRKAKNTYQHISPIILSDKIDKAYKLDMNPLYLNSERVSYLREEISYGTTTNVPLAPDSPGRILFCRRDD